TCVLFLAALSLAFAGCAGYRLGPTSGVKPGETSVTFEPVQNETLEPRLGDALAAALRKQLQRDGTFRLATDGAGDLVVSARVKKYHREELSLVPGDLVTARDYRVWATVQFIARERSSGKVLLDETVTGKTLIRVGNDLQSTEREAMPLLADDVAKTLVAKLADGSW
ncbi:MAG: hypothetical protein EPO07_11085, partial [Verrucomicrobia bacterium]